MGIEQPSGGRVPHLLKSIGLGVANRRSISLVGRSSVLYAWIGCLSVQHDAARNFTDSYLMLADWVLERSRSVTDGGFCTISTACALSATVIPSEREQEQVYALVACTEFSSRLGVILSK